MEINFSNEVKAVLENSRKEAIRHNNSIITPEHMFLALLADTGVACILSAGEGVARSFRLPASPAT